MKRKPLPRGNTAPLACAIVPALALSLLTLAWTAPAPNQPPRRNVPEIPEVARGDAICFAYYTVHRGVLKMTAQLYPLKDGESRVAKLEVKDGTDWKTVATTRVTEDDYNNYRKDKTWTAHFRVESWDENRSAPYRVTALEGVATYEGTIRANPVGQREIVVAAFTGNSNQDRRLKPELIANLEAQDPDLLFFSGDQVYDHTDHLGAWLLFGRQFREVIKDRPMISIPDDHDIGQANLWGAGGKVSTNAAGDDGGYFMPVEYVRAVERAQTWHLPDPVDPASIERGLGVYFTALNWGGISFAILEDRKFKTGPNGPLELKPKFAPRPDWVTNANYDPKALDLPGLRLLGERQEQFLKEWGEDWTDAEFKVVLSQTIFSYATHLSHGNRLLADLDSNGWPQSGRQRAVDLMRRCFAFHICGDQHLGCVAQYGIDDWRDANVAFCVPSIVNYYPRKWLPLDPPVRAIEGPLPHLGDYVEGFGNKLTMFTYANPTAFPAPLTNLAASASGHGLVRFDKTARKITIECWPRGVDVTQPDAKQYPGWPVTIDQLDNYGRRPVAWLPEIEAPEGMTNPVVQVWDERNGDLVYTLRTKSARFKPWVFAEGTYTVRFGEPPDRLTTRTGQRTMKLSAVGRGGPQPGDVFREYLWTNLDGDAGGSLRVGGRVGYGGGPIVLPHEFDLEHAFRAEVVLEKLLCHDGTRGLAISVNSNNWIEVPATPGIPQPQWDIMHHTYPIVAIPLAQLEAGSGNQVRLRVSDEHPWNWPQHLIYGVHFRVYYDAAKKPHPVGRLIYPEPDAALGTKVVLEAEAASPNGRIRQVDFLGHHEDVNLEGDGEYSQWHYHFHRAALTNHIGSVAAAPWRLTWDTSWVPDQPNPFSLAARVTDETGLTCFTEAVSGLTFQRDGLAVELCKPYDVPQKWLTRTGEKTQKFRVTGDLSKAVAARLVWVSWSPGYMEGLYLNGHRVLDREGPKYAYYAHRVPVPDLAVLQPGENRLRTGKTPLHDGRMVHGMELNWPGIMVLVQYRN